MRSALYDAYLEVLAMDASTEGGVPAAEVPGHEQNFISLGQHQQPQVLLRCRDPQALRKPPLSLQNLSVEWGVPFRVRVGSRTVQDEFVVVSLGHGNLDLASAFCIACEVLISSLTKVPTLDEIERVVIQLVQVFDTINEPSRRSVAGLWAELWLMCSSADRPGAVEAWHMDADERFDFSFSERHVEVKATQQETRVHDFSLQQLREAGRPIIVASLLLRASSFGRTLEDLVADLQKGLTPELRAKVVKNAFKAIGSAIADTTEIRFDEKFASENLRLIEADGIPVPLVPTGEPISSVRFRVDLGAWPVRQGLRQAKIDAVLGASGEEAL